jgi:drug/metabolite transporter (DMT)-like permease
MNFMDKQMWLVYAALAGICWGTYVPFVQQGIQGLGRNALASFLCVGVAYFLIAVLYPVGMFIGGERTPEWNLYGISMATLAGVAGALGALCVILANRAVARAFPDDPAQAANYRLYIGPVIFALAPVLNAVVSTVWHPSPTAGAFHFGLDNVPNWKLWVGIVMTGAGAALVLYSKEESERAHQQRPAAVAPQDPHIKPV